MIDYENKKLLRIANRIKAELPKDHIARIIQQNKRYQQLSRQREEAVAAKQFLRVRIIDTQIESHTNDLMMAEVGKVAHEYCHNGKIDDYLEAEDHDRLERASACLFMLMDAIDTTANDILGVYEAVGLAPEELYVQTFLRDFRKKADEWFRNNRVSNTAYEEATRQEGDNCYDFARKRQEVLFRKLDRIYEREKKASEKAKKATLSD